MAFREMNDGQLSELDRYSGWEVSQGMDGARWGDRDDRVREGPRTGGWRPCHRFQNPWERESSTFKLSFPGCYKVYL